MGHSGKQLQQLAFNFGGPDSIADRHVAQLSALDLDSYDRILLAFSGGKDSIACLCHLIDLGYRDKIELHHHDVDGSREDGHFMDWPVTPSYCRAVAAAFGVPIYFSYKEGGFRREMLRDSVATAPTWFETPNGDWVKVGGNGNSGTRLKFPQVSPNLAVRWCSSYLKVDIMDRLITNQDRFQNSRTLVVSGERAEESAARSKYNVFEPHRTSSKAGGRLHRHVDVWRPVHGWSEADVWAIIKKHGVVPHPAYYLGWSRLSCMACIFGNPSQWRSVQMIAPSVFDQIAAYEIQFGLTIRREESVVVAASRGATYAGLEDPVTVALALAEQYDGPVLIDPFLWLMPSGAFGKSGGPS